MNSTPFADAVYQAALRQLRQDRANQVLVEIPTGDGVIGPWYLFNGRESWSSGAAFARPAAAPTAPEAR